MKYQELLHEYEATKKSLNQIYQNGRLCVQKLKDDVEMKVEVVEEAKLELIGAEEKARLAFQTLLNSSKSLGNDVNLEHSVEHLISLNNTIHSREVELHFTHLALKNAIGLLKAISSDNVDLFRRKIKSLKKKEDAILLQMNERNSNAVKESIAVEALKKKLASFEGTENLNKAYTDAVKKLRAAADRLYSAEMNLFAVQNSLHIAQHLISSISQGPLPPAPTLYSSVFTSRPLGSVKQFASKDISCRFSVQP